MNRLFSTITVLLFCSCIFAQSAEDIMKKAETSFNNDGGVKANFTLAVENKAKATAESFDGTILMRGNKFFIQTPEIKVWYNGKDQWTLLSNSDEVNLTSPTEAESDAMNPSVLFKLYKNGFKATMLKDKKIQNQSYYQILLEPKTKRADLRSITVSINISNFQIKEIVMDQNNQWANKILITQYNRNQTLKDSDFVFNPKQYPTIELIDLR
ncbi:MAG: LolA-like putative outer membrane lipoprotein chaperone [Bacteroidales bacterium]